MKIREVSWSNYRRLPDGRIAVRNHLVLVGPNDSGKTSVAHALHATLGMAHGQVAASITARDFTDPALPLTITVTLDRIDDEDRKVFPDEISTGPPEVLLVDLTATLDPVDPDQRVVRRSFPDSGHNRAPTKDQLAAIGFVFVPAARSLLRELGGASGGAVRSLLAGLDLSADAAALTAAASGYRDALDKSLALIGFRTDLAAALSDALPTPVPVGDVRVVPETEVLDDPLSGVTVTVKDGDHVVPLAEQSDGIRALSALTLLGMSHKTARIMSVDEPETHLHLTAQRSMARKLREAKGQRVLVTHSPAVVGQMDPLDLVAFGADRRVRQLPATAPIAALDVQVRHWTQRIIEPLTARRVLLVEGVSDRIVVEQVARLIGLQLDRLGVAIFELDSKNFFPTAYDLFGPDGYDLPLVGLLDEDAREKCAEKVGVLPVELETSGFIICEPDLEGMYIAKLGVAVVRQTLADSPAVTEPSLLQSCGVSTLTDVGRAELWSYCNRHKVAAALAVSPALTEAQARSLTPVVDVLALVS